MACGQSGLKVPNWLPKDRWLEELKPTHRSPATPLRHLHVACPVARKTFSGISTMRHQGQHLLPTLTLSLLLCLLWIVLWLITRLF